MTYTEWYNKYCNYLKEGDTEYRMNVLYRIWAEARLCDPAKGEGDDLERNAKYRAEAVKPMVDELKAIRGEVKQMRVFLKSHHDILVEILKNFSNPGGLVP